MAGIDFSRLNDQARAALAWAGVIADNENSTAIAASQVLLGAVMVSRGELELSSGSDAAESPVRRVIASYRRRKANSRGSGFAAGQRQFDAAVISAVNASDGTLPGMVAAVGQVIGVSLSLPGDPISGNQSMTRGPGLLASGSMEAHMTEIDPPDDNRR